MIRWASLYIRVVNRVYRLVVVIGTGRISRVAFVIRTTSVDFTCLVRLGYWLVGVIWGGWGATWC